MDVILSEKDGWVTGKGFNRVLYAHREIFDGLPASIVIARVVQHAERLPKTEHHVKLVNGAGWI